VIGETDMDGGPFRVPEPADRRVVSRRSEPSYRQPEEEPEPVKEVPEAIEPVRRPAVVPQHLTKEKKKVKRFKLPIIVIIIIVILAIVGFFAWSNSQNAGTAIDSSKYQAVFFTNGQVYFGKLQAFNSQYMKLTDIFYLQTSSDSSTSANPQETSTDQSNVQLIKLGNEIHGPEDEMIISKDQVLFYENLKPTGKVAESIAKYAGTK
jgi:hypothetical protein